MLLKYTVTSSDGAAAAALKPRRRRLSSYIDRDRNKNKTVLPVNTHGNIPNWLKLLLNDDIHTGRNIGTKLAYLCPDGASEDDQ